MPLLLELSGEHPTLPAAEALAVLGMEGEVREELREDTLLLAHAAHADPQRVAARLGLAHGVAEPLASCAPDQGAILDAVRALAPRIGPVFRVRCHRVGEHGRELSPSAVEREAGAALAQGRKVALEGPADELRILLGRHAHLALALAAIDRTPFDARHVRHRPHVRPVALHPRFARALVNLARVRPGDRVADPFAGTGGLLAEAALVGAQVHGGDLDPEMAQGARDFLAREGLAGEVVVGDVASTLASLAPLDAIVTDPPYGRSSWTDREKPDDLHRRALAAVAEALRPGGRAAIVLPSRAVAEDLPPSLKLEQAHVQRVHRSLDRHHLVFRKV